MERKEKNKSQKRTEKKNDDIRILKILLVQVHNFSRHRKNNLKKIFMVYAIVKERKCRTSKTSNKLIK